MAYKNIVYNEKGNVARIMFNRPEKHNALSNETVDEFHDALDQAENNDTIKVVVFSGAGPSFCSGHDLSEVAHQYGWEEPKSGEKTRRPSQRVRLSFDRKNLCERLRRIFLFPKITIAQVHGNCVGEGFYTVSLCDLAIASKDAKFARLEQRLGFGGMGPDFPILVMTIGFKRTMDLLLSGRTLSGEEAEAIGFVNKAVPFEELEQEVEKWTEKISRFSADGIAIAKAERHLNFEAMRMTSGFVHDYLAHTLVTNFRIEPGEYNFLKERRDSGLTDAIHKRDGHFEKRS